MQSREPTPVTALHVQYCSQPSMFFSMCSDMLKALTVIWCNHLWQTRAKKQNKKHKCALKGI